MSLGALMAAILLLSAGRLAAQQDGVWSQPAVGGLWSDSNNWSFSVVANSADHTADFSRLVLSGNETVHLNPARVIGNLVFGDVGNAFNWTIDNGGSVGNTLTLSVTSGAPTITVVNGTATISAVLSGSKGFNLLGPETDAFGQGVLILNGSTVNTISGTVRLSGASLLLDFSNLSPATNLLKASVPLVLGSGTLTINDCAGTNTTSQTFASATLNAGASRIAVNSGGNSSAASTLALGSISRSAAATLDIALPARGIVTTTTANTAATILGGWAIVAGTDWAVSGGNGTTAGNLAALASYQTDNFAAAANNVTVTASNSPAAGFTINSLRFNSPTSDPSGITETFSGANVIASGGILVTPNVGATNVTLTGGTLTSANSQNELIVQQFDANNLVTIAAAIVDHGPPTALTKSGPGRLVLATSGQSGNQTSANTYSGGTYINQGILSIADDTCLGAVPASPATNITFTGSGVLQANLNPSGPTTLSLSANRGIQINSGAAATIDTNGFQIDYGGPITGTGGLAIVNNTGNNTTGGQGLHLFPFTANTYTGPTTVNGGILTLDYSASQSNGGDAVSNANVMQINSAGTLYLGGVICVKPPAADATAPFAATVQTLAAGLRLIPNSSSLIYTANSGLTGTAFTLSSGGGLVRPSGSTLAFGIATNVNFFLDASVTNSGGIIGGWATIGVIPIGGAAPSITDWAIVNGSGAVIPFLSVFSNHYVSDGWVSTGNTTVTTDSIQGAGAATNSLRFDAPVSATVTLLGSGTIVNGGILITPDVGDFSNTITGGTLTSATGVDLIVNQFNPVADGGLTISSQVTGSIGVTLAGNPLVLGGLLVLDNPANNYTGPTSINANTTLQCGAAGVVPAVSAVVLSGTAAFNLNGFNQSIGSLAGNSTGTTVSNGTSFTAATLTVGNNNTNTTFAGLIADGSATLSLIKVGAGALSLAGSNTYSGGTTITGGILNINADAALGNSAGGITFNGSGAGGTLQLAAGFAGTSLASTQTITVVANDSGTIDTNGNGTSAAPIIYSGSLAVSGTFTKAGSGVFSLNTTPTLGSGATLAAAGGTFRLKFPGTPSNLSGVQATVASGATLELAGPAAQFGPSVNINNAGGLLISSSVSQPVGAITGGGGIVVNTAASLTAYQIRQNSLSINGTGTVTLRPSGSGSLTSPGAPNNVNYSSSLNSLSIGGTTNAWTGKLDIGNNGLVIQYGGGADPYATIVNMVESGYGTGHWTGNGITSSLAAAAANSAAPLNIGLRDFIPGQNGDPTSLQFAGQTITTSAVLVRLTYMDDLVLAGDMLQGNATSDALRFAANYGTGTTWSVGDLNHDGAINTGDALIFAANYVVGLPSLDGTTGNAAGLGSAAAVPEPSSLAIVVSGGIGLAGLFARCRRSRPC